MAKVAAKIVDEITGKPISGVTVNLNNAGITVESDITSNDGMFVIDNPASESINGTLEFLKNGYLRMYYPSNNYDATIQMQKSTDYFSKIPWWAYVLIVVGIVAAIYFFMHKKK